jgi:hypothetical protein
MTQPGPAPERKAEYPLEVAEFFASAAVTVAAGVGVLAVANNPAYAAASDLILLLFVAVVPIVSSLPVWGIALFSDTYEPRLGPAVEAGSTVAAIALVLWLIGDLVNSNPLTYTAYIGLAVGMPLAEVISLNLTKLPKGMGFNAYSSNGPPPWDPPPGLSPQAAAPLGKTFAFALPPFSF